MQSADLLGSRADGWPQLFASGRQGLYPRVQIIAATGLLELRLHGAPVRACRSSSSTARDLVYVPAGIPGSLRFGEGGRRPRGAGSEPWCLATLSGDAFLRLRASAFPGYSSTRGGIAYDPLFALMP